MVTMHIDLPESRAVVTISRDDLTHYCGPSYHVGWLAGLGYAAVHVEGEIQRLDDKTPLDKSLAVEYGDVLKFVYDPLAAIKLINLCNVRTKRDATSSSSTSSSSMNSRRDTDVVSTRDPMCVFTGSVAAPCQAHMLPVKVYSRGRFHEVGDMLGLERIGELPNLLRMVSIGADALDDGYAAILASDRRFVPLEYLQDLDASKAAEAQALRPRLQQAAVTSADIPIVGDNEDERFQLYYQHLADTNDDLPYLLDRLGFYHDVVARFTPTAFNEPRSAPAREVLHYMYWGRMLYKYCDPDTRKRLQHVQPLVPKPPSVESNGSDGSGTTDNDEGSEYLGSPAPKRRRNGNASGHRAADSSTCSSKRQRPSASGGTDGIEIAPPRGDEVVEFLLGFQRCLGLRVEGPTGPDKAPGDAVLEWQQTSQLQGN